MPTSEKKALEWLDRQKGTPALVRGIFIALIFLGGLSILIFSQQFYDFIANSSGDSVEDTSLSGGGFSENCTVAGINMHGTLLTYIPYHADGDVFYDYDLVARYGI